MIDKRDILEAASALGLLPSVVEKDYVLGWLLAGIHAHPELTGPGPIHQTLSGEFRVYDQRRLGSRSGTPYFLRGHVYSFSSIQHRSAGVTGHQIHAHSSKPASFGISAAGHTVTRRPSG